MSTYFKAVRPDGSSFHDPNFKWALEPGEVTVHPAPKLVGRDACTYLSVSTVPTDCTGFGWPCRLLEVEPVGETWIPDVESFPNKAAGTTFRTVRELPASDVFGPYGEHVVAIIGRASRFTADEVQAFVAWDAGWDAVWSAARAAARAAARSAARAATRAAARAATRDAARAAARDAAGGAAVAWVCKDLITDEQFDLLTAPWNTIINKEEAA